MFYIYYTNEAGKNVVTDYYMDVIARAVKKNGGEVKEVFACPKKIEHDDSIITLSCYTFWKSYSLHPKNTISWMQGVAPEELKMNGDHWLRKLFFINFFTFLEKFTLKRCDLLLFVSEGMLNHYRKKYNYKGENYIIMPCMNEESVYDNAFYDEKYSKPTFVYTGDINEWQCFDEMLLLFKDIKKRIPEAELNVYTGKQELAKQKLGQYGIAATLDCKAREELNDAIKGMKYGFIIRKDIAVNNVASPTKMSTYLANGVIPIFSDCIGDYDKQIGTMHYAVPLGNNYEGIERLYSLETEIISATDVKDEFKNLFEDYYNSDKYISIIADRIQRL